jgi:hypothetical protein
MWYSTCPTSAKSITTLEAKKRKTENETCFTLFKKGGGGLRKNNRGMNLIKEHYIQIWKYHNEKTLFTINIC